MISNLLIDGVRGRMPFGHSPLEKLMDRTEKDGAARGTLGKSTKPGRGHVNKHGRASRRSVRRTRRKVKLTVPN